MKSLSLFVASLVIFIALWLINTTSCVKDTCSAISCQNGGICVDGKCTCPTGYEGVLCGSKWNEKYIGTWHVSDSIYKDDKARFHYDITVLGGITKDSFYISGLTDTLRDSLLLCYRSTAKTFTFVADRKLDSVLTIKSGNGTIDSITGIVTGKYTYQRKDTTVTVGFTWHR